MNALNITLLTRALAEANNSQSLRTLFEAGGEINEDLDDTFAIVPRPTGLEVKPKSNGTEYEVMVGLNWLNNEDGRHEIADIGIIWNAETNQLTSAYCWGYSHTQEEWKELYK